MESAPPTTAPSSARGPRQVYINLQVADLARSIRFYEAVGFRQHPYFKDHTSVGMVNIANPAIVIMITIPARFRDFVPAAKAIADARTTTETIVCLSCDTRDEVDELLASAVEHGGKGEPTKMAEMPEGMYGRSWEDPDGHVWETVWASEKIEEEAKKAEAEACAGKKAETK